MKITSMTANKLVPPLYQRLRTIDCRQHHDERDQFVVEDKFGGSTMVQIEFKTSSP